MDRPPPAGRRHSQAYAVAGGLLAGLGLVWPAAAAPATSPTGSPPNVVVFLADDAGWGDYGASGNRLARTPAIDSLAHDGVTFERFFVCPVCAPTRAEFLTGRWYPRTGVHGVSLGQERLDPDERTIADFFRAAGYATGCFGKWHNGTQWPYHPMARGFDTFYGHSSGHWGEYFDPPLEREGRMERAHGYIVDVCTSEAIAFIERHHDRPFFCYVPFTTPHSPWAVPEKHWRRYRDLPIEQRATEADRERADETRCALAMLENQDENVARLLAALERLGLTENTIVVYFSDNGPNGWRWNGGMAGRKGTTDEGGVRSVCFIRWPAGVPRQGRVAEIAAAIDLLPTLTGLAGVPCEGGRPLDGRDLTPLMRAETTAWPERFIVSTWAGDTSVRSQDHRLDAAGRLFDVANDPGQTRDLAATLPAIAARLRLVRESWWAEMPADARPDGRLVRGNGLDPRPLGVGYREFPITMLPARDGQPRGGVARSSRAPNCSYFVNWKDSAGEMVWEIDVQTAGRYDVVIDYTCPPADAGATIELAFGESRLVGRVEPGWDPPLYSDQDTLPRPDGESPMKEFRPLALGTIDLPRRRGPLVLRALEVPGAAVMDVRRVTLTLEPPRLQP